MSGWAYVSGRIVRAIVACGFFLSLALCMPHGAAFAAKSAKSGKTAGGAICKIDDDEDNDDGDDDSDASAEKEIRKRFLIGGTCTELSGELSLVGQKTLKQNGSVPALITRRGVLSPQDTVAIGGTLTMRVETARETSSGALKTALELKGQQDSGSEGGIVNLSEGFVSWLGWTAGYTDSLMNFWTGDDFQFSANAPNRTVGRVSFEAHATEDLAFSVAAETGVPTVRGGIDTRFMPVTFDDPVVSARALYDADDLTLHLSGMVHEQKRGGGNPLLVPLGLGASASASGWAGTAGMTLPLDTIHEDDEFSIQASYAVNASAYLGTNTDLATLAAVAPSTADTRGWSALASYHHAWSDRWETNVFASRLDLEVNLPLATPRIGVMRYAGNLVWEPVDNFKLGGELGYVDLKLSPNGTAGFFKGLSGQALVGYLFATWTF